MMIVPQISHGHVVCWRRIVFSFDPVQMNRVQCIRVLLLQRTAADGRRQVDKCDVIFTTAVMASMMCGRYIVFELCMVYNFELVKSSITIELWFFSLYLV